MMQHYTTDILVDYVNGELAAEADALVYMHLVDCSVCRENYEEEKALREALVAFGQRSEREIPQSLIDSIHAAVKPQTVHPLAALGALLRPRIALPALGGVFSLVLGIAFFTSHQGTATTVDAHVPIEVSAFLDRHSDANVVMPFSDHVNAPTFESAADPGDTVDTPAGSGSSI